MGGGVPSAQRSAKLEDFHPNQCYEPFTFHLHPPSLVAPGTRRSYGAWSHSSTSWPPPPSLLTQHAPAHC